MIAAISERGLSNLIRQTEGLSPEVTVEEIGERLGHYAKKIFRHVHEAFGLRFVGLNQRGSIADLKLVIETRDRKHIMDGLTFLAPICVSLEKEDLGSLVNGRVTMADHWPLIQTDLQKLSPFEIFEALEKAASKIIDEAYATTTIEGNLESFEEWCTRHNLPIPGGDRALREQQRQNELAARKAADEARFNANEGGDWFVRERDTVE